MWCGAVRELMVWECGERESVVPFFFLFLFGGKELCQKLFSFAFSLSFFFVCGGARHTHTHKSNFLLLFVAALVILWIGGYLRISFFSRIPRLLRKSFAGNFWRVNSSFNHLSLSLVSLSPLSRLSRSPSANVTGFFFNIN